MDPSATQDEFAPRPASPSTLAKSLAPEDVRVGDYVTVLHMIYEVPSWLWCSDGSIVDREVPVRMQFVPMGGGVPLKVKSVCLPFVLVKHPSGKQRPIDIRRCRLARLDRDYAKMAWKTYGKKPHNRGAKKNKKKR